MSCDIHYNQKAHWISKREVTPSQPQAVNVVHEASLFNIIAVVVVFPFLVVL
jgi:hypothetical protein